MERAFNREYLRLLIENGIDIVFPQVVINYSNEKQYKVTRKGKVDAREFAKAQNKLSKNIEEQQS